MTTWFPRPTAESGACIDAPEIGLPAESSPGNTRSPQSNSAVDEARVQVRAQRLLRMEWKSQLPEKAGSQFEQLEQQQPCFSEFPSVRPRIDSRRSSVSRTAGELYLYPQNSPTSSKFQSRLCRLFVARNLAHSRVQYTKIKRRREYHLRSTNSSRDRDFIE